MKTSLLLLIFSAAVSPAWSVYQVHEWGTFTTVSGSDGTLLPGLEREEEQLPNFVHSHTGLENGQSPDPAEIMRISRQHGSYFAGQPNTKGLGKRPLAGVTVKMETPVIYFHSNEPSPIHVKVKVGFDGGTISQWYPQRSAGETLPEPPPTSDPKNKPTPLSAWTLDFTKPYHGAIEWEADVLPPEETRQQVLFKPGDNLGWLRARQPVTNAVRTTGGETEGYLFYRGVGNFNPGLKTTVDGEETLHLENQTGGGIPYLVVFDLADGKLRWRQQIGGLPAGGSIAIPESTLTAEPDGFAEPLYRALQTGLAGCGLTDAEARAMVETWWHSYFETPGLRVFWVLPRATTDRILPLEISPVPPTEIVRVLVGRSEVFRPRQEREWQKLATLKDPDGGAIYRWTSLVANDRFGLAIQKRVKSLDKSAAPTASK